MSSNTHWLVSALAMALASSVMALAPAKQFTPRWEVGTTWTVKTAFRRMYVMSPDAGGLWSDPVRFDYRVTQKRADASGTTFTLVAAPHKKTTGFETIITVVSDLSGKLSVRSVTARKLRHGQIVSDRVDYATATPVFTENSIVPYDAPVFPLVKPADLQTSSFLSTKKKYTRAESIGGLTFARVGSQLVRGATGASSYTDGTGREVDFQVPVDAAAVFPVDMEEETTRQKVAQYWAEGQPWALYSETSSTRSWLVPPQD